MTMLKRLLLVLPLFLLTHCTPANSTRSAAVSTSPPTVEAQQPVSLRSPEEELELFNYALDQA